MTACPAIVYQVEGASQNEAWAIRGAIWQLEEATGQQYVTGSDPSLIIAFNWSDPTLDSNSSWVGYTSANLEHIGIRQQYETDAAVQAIVMHELMLSRGIIEVPDPGGMLGHIVDPNQNVYSDHDVALLAQTGCR